MTWDELNSVDRADSFDIFMAAARAQAPDAWEGYFDVDQVLTDRIKQVVKR